MSTGLYADIHYKALDVCRNASQIMEKATFLTHTGLGKPRNLARDTRRAHTSIGYIW